jgi:solute carrier family 12 (potassium/chloride transporter), member 4/6
MITQETKKLGTFLGVFTPTILTILGVIMYMRAGWVTGQMGLGKTLLIVFIANSITLITTLSFSSVATNKKVGAGGAYYIISRTLGFAIGGAIGVPLFLSQAFSITLYSFGLAEVLNFLVPWMPVAPIAFIIIICVAALSFKGADFALKTQIPVMAAVAISLVFLAVGAFLKTDISSVRFSEPTGEVTFFTAFAIFFPAVTGIMAGLGLSGDLKNPQKSIPLGAISATLAGFVIYLSVPVLLVMGADDPTLINDVMVWSRIAPAGALFIIPGLLGAIFSSAVGSMLGAPRTLGALIADQFENKTVIDFFNSPKGAKTVFGISVFIALSAVFLGNLNDVATVVTLFFLTVYGVVNITAALEGLSNEPSWRPKFRIPWMISLAGGIACIIVMFLINPLASFAAIVIEFLLYVFLKKKSEKSVAGDARRGVYEKVIKNSLLNLRNHPMTARNWRPHLQIIINDPQKQKNLVKFASFFGENSGIVTVTQLIEGKLGEDVIDIEGKTQFMEKFYGEKNLIVFPEVTIVDDFEQGIITAVQANGMAGLQSNTIMICWPDEIEYLPKYLSIMRRISVLSKSFIIGKVSLELKLLHKNSKPRSIHVWWGGLQRNGDMMLLLAYLLTTSVHWKNSVIRMISIVDSKDMENDAFLQLSNLANESRINAVPQIIVKEKDKTFTQIIHETSTDADVVFMGLNTPEKGDEEAYALKLQELAGKLKSVFFIKNSSVFKGTLLEADISEGKNNE